MREKDMEHLKNSERESAVLVPSVEANANHKRSILRQLKLSLKNNHLTMEESMTKVQLKKSIYSSSSPSSRTTQGREELKTESN